MASTYNSSLYNVSSEIRPADQEAKSDSESSKLFGLSHLCCLSVPHYRLRIFKNKAAALVLLWSFSGFCVFHFLINGHKNPLIIGKKEVNPAVVFGMCILVYPVHGWLADVRFGRYKVIKWSLRVMLVLFIFFCVAVALLDHQSLSNTSPISKHTEEITKIVLYGLICLGLGGFLANVIQFGIDQLVDASSSEITSFLRWLSWVWFLSQLCVSISQSCLCDYHKSLGNLLLPGVLTIAISSDVLLNHWLVKEPGSDNPLVLIFKVLRYAKKNKYPRQRSAFTYWDDRRYSRIDLGKDKYGGPFSTEEVEDVKTFFRIISIIIVGCSFTSLYISVYPFYVKVASHLHDDYYMQQKKHYDCEYSFINNCFQRAAVVDISGPFLMVIGLPLFEFIFYPFFKRYLKVSILKKMSVGMAMILLALITCSAIEFVGQHESHQLVNKTCPLASEDQSNSLPLDYKWMVIPYISNSLAFFLLLTAFSEFLCAQSPYSMKGFLFGFTYGSIGIFAIIGYGLSKIIQLITEKWLSYRYGCLFWYLILYLAILFIIIVIFFFAFKCYKRRLRDDNEHNEQIFAVNYYSQCQDSTE